MSEWICIDDICIPSDENDWEELVAFADVVAEQEPIEIVRCGECEHYNGETHGCKRNPCVMPWEENDFCSYGERGDE